MNAKQVMEAIGRERASAILRTNRKEAAAPAMEAAIRGGFRVLEFTLTTPGAMDLIEQFAGREGLVVGAGTVLTPGDAREAVRRGAKYLVSPVTDPDVVQAALELGVVVMPGAHTPTELLRAHRLGAQLQKLFPAPAGGPVYVSSCLAPMPFLKIVPTNGVTAENAPAYLRAGSFAVGFVAAVFDAEDVNAGRWERIEQKSREALAAVRAAGA